MKTAWILTPLAALAVLALGVATTGHDPRPALAGFLWGENNEQSTGAVDARAGQQLAGYVWDTRKDDRGDRAPQPDADTRRYLVQGHNSAAVAAAVASAGGRITHRLKLI